jgi:hypothetical protein
VYNTDHGINDFIVSRRDNVKVERSIHTRRFHVEEFNTKIKIVDASLIYDFNALLKIYITCEIELSDRAWKYI